MAGVFWDTPNWYTRAQAPLLYTLVENGTIDVGPYGRASSPAFRFTGDPDDYIARAVVTSGATAILERDLYITAYPASGQRKPIIQFLEGGDVQMGLYLEDDGTVSACRGEGGALTVLGTSSAAVALATHYRVGFKTLLHASAGTADAQLQGPGDLTPQSVLALTGQDTLETASATWDAFRCGAASPTMSTLQNIVVKDGSGGVHDDLHNAPQNVYVTRSIDDIASPAPQWARSAGIRNFANVDDLTADGDVTYNQADIEGLLDLLRMQESPDPNLPISMVATVFVARNGGGSEEVQAVMRQGGANTYGTPQVLTGTSRPYLELYQTSPDATAWSPAVYAAIAAEGVGYNRVAVT